MSGKGRGEKAVCVMAVGGQVVVGVGCEWAVTVAVGGVGLWEEWWAVAGCGKWLLVMLGGCGNWWLSVGVGGG